MGKDDLMKIDGHSTFACNKNTVVTAAGTTQYSGSEINMAETYDEDHFDIEIEDDDVTPIIC